MTIDIIEKLKKLNTESPTQGNRNFFKTRGLAAFLGCNFETKLVTEV